MRFTMPDGTMRPLAHATRRPPEPFKDQYVRYRGWECSYNSTADWWTGGKEAWEAYKGGVDLDAPRVAAGSWSALLDAVDDEEDEPALVFEGSNDDGLTWTRIERDPDDRRRWRIEL